jgi:hypothetical protein
MFIHFIVPLIKQIILIIYFYFLENRRRKSSVGIATGYGLDGSGWIPGRGKIFPFSTASRPPLGIQPASYSMVTAGDFPEDKTVEA